MSQHTPGPWKVDKMLRIYSEDEFVARIDPQRYSYTEQANARLIAQAPAMLEALKRCVGYFQYMAAQNSDLTPDYTWMEPIRAILRAVEEAKVMPTHAQHTLGPWIDLRSLASAMRLEAKYQISQYATVGKLESRSEWYHRVYCVEPN